VKLELERYYNKNYNAESYKHAQIKRHTVKRHKKRSVKFYSRVSEIILSLVKDIESKEMISLGSRNNHEKFCFSRDLNCNVFSSDIAPSSKTDYIIDFNFMPDDWKDKWDIIYSNSIDHAINPTKTYEAWLACLKVGGLLVIGFLDGGEATSHDCSTFSIDDVSEFFKNQENIEVLKTKAIEDYHHFFLRRLSI
jgi:hypothetical protein